MVLLGWTKNGHAQTDPVLSKQGYFGVDYVKGCAPLKVEVIAENGEGTTRNFKWISEKGDFIQFGTGKSFTFTQPDTYYIIQNILSEDEGRFDTIRVQVLEPIGPQFTASNCGNGEVVIKAVPDFYDYFIVNGNENYKLSVDNDFELPLAFPVGPNQITVKGMYEGEGVYNNCEGSTQTIEVRQTLLPVATFSGLLANISDNSIQIEYTLLPYVNYELQVQRNGTGEFETLIPTLSGNEITLTADNFPEMEVASNFYCFRIRTVNPCDPDISDPSFFSDNICSASLTGLPQDNGNYIQYKTLFDPGITVSLLRDSQEINNWENKSEGDFLDMEVNCNTSYSYSILISYPNGSVSLTEPLTLTPEIKGSLPAIENISSYWENNSPHFQPIIPTPPEEAKYFAYYADSENPELVVSSSGSTALKLVNQESNSCYNFSYLDGCGNTSLLRENVCALFLSNNTSQPDVLRLEWSEYNGYKEGVREYELEEYDAQGNLIQTYPVGSQTFIDLGEQPIENTGYQYMVKAYPVDGSLEITSSNIYVFQIVMKSYFPNAFSPDGDGLNDFFKAQGKFVKSGQLEIFNRWGSAVFKTNDVLTGWDGKVNGDHAQQSTYVYKATITTEDGIQKSYEGTVFLMRK